MKKGQRKSQKSPNAPPTNKNRAFVFIKPHAVTAKVQELVKSGLEAHGIKIVQEGSITANEIDEKMLIDQHYYAIASKATILKPAQLNVPADKFQAQFGLTWKEALDKGVVYNAKDACEVLGTDADGLDKAWAQCKKADKLVKFGGGFYCGLIDTFKGKAPIYVFNGFFMSMRSKFVAPGVSIYYYVVEFDSKQLSWADFRGKVLGPTDPAEAPADSLRGQIAARWKELGLAYAPDVGDNGVHASASPFEALAERLNWLGGKLETDAYGKALLEAGIPAETLRAWTIDPQVVFGGKKGSLFDNLEDLDADACLAKAVKLALENAPRESAAPILSAHSKYIPVAPLTTREGLSHLNEFLSTRSYLNGYVASAVDIETFHQTPPLLNAADFPHAARWSQHIAALTAWEQDRLLGRS